MNTRVVGSIVTGLENAGTARGAVVGTPPADFKGVSAPKNCGFGLGTASSVTCEVSFGVNLEELAGDAVGAEYSFSVALGMVVGKFSVDCFDKITERGAPFEEFEVVDVVVCGGLFTGGTVKATGTTRTTVPTIWCNVQIN